MKQLAHGSSFSKIKGPSGSLQIFMPGCFRRDINRSEVNANNCGGTWCNHGYHLLLKFTLQDMCALNFEVAVVACMWWQVRLLWTRLTGELDEVEGIFFGVLDASWLVGTKRLDANPRILPGSFFPNPGQSQWLVPSWHKQMSQARLDRLYGPQIHQLRGLWGSEIWLRGDKL